MPTVYIINKAVHDFSAAKMYGDLHYLTNKPINRYATNKIFRHFHNILDKSEPEDYLLITSLNVMNIIAAAIFVLKHKKLNLLIHKTDNNTYVERRLDLSDLY